MIEAYGDLLSSDLKVIVNSLSPPPHSPPCDQRVQAHVPIHALPIHAGHAYSSRDFPTHLSKKKKELRQVGNVKAGTASTFPGVCVCVCVCVCIDKTIKHIYACSRTITRPHSYNNHAHTHTHTHTRARANTHTLIHTERHTDTNINTHIHTHTLTQSRGSCPCGARSHTFSSSSLFRGSAHAEEERRVCEEARP